MDRRNFLKNAGRALGCLGLMGSAGFLLKDAVNGNLPVIDPESCVGCGRCATACVFTPSAIKCYNIDDVCSHCTACYGFHRDTLTEPVNNKDLVCPQNAIIREVNPDENGGGFTYTVDESKCNGCGICVKLCWEHGSKSMRLVVKHDICKRCNQCQIANICDGGAFSCDNG